MKRHDSPVLERRYFSKDQMIITEGEFGQQAYLLQSGEVKVYLSKDQDEVEIAKLEPGQIFGEMAFIFDGPRTASVKAITDVNVIVISRRQFEDKLKDSDPTIRAIVSMLSHRILDANQSVVNKRGGVRDLKEAAKVVYENIAVKLPQNQLWSLQNTVLPKLEELFQALDSFQDRYGSE